MYCNFSKFSERFPKWVSHVFYTPVRHLIAYWQALSNTQANDRFRHLQYSLRHVLLQLIYSPQQHTHVCGSLNRHNSLDLTVICYSTPSVLRVLYSTLTVMRVCGLKHFAPFLESLFLFLECFRPSSNLAVSHSCQRTETRYRTTMLESFRLFYLRSKGLLPLPFSPCLNHFTDRKAGPEPLP